MELTDREEDMLKVNTLFSMSELLIVPKPKESKHQFEFQEVCKELEKTYGKLVWTLPYKSGFTEYKIREGHRIATERGIQTFQYLYGIIRKLP